MTRGVTLPRPRRLPRWPPDLRSVASSMPLGLMVGPPFRPLSRAISSRCAATSRFSSATSPSNWTTKASSSARDKPDRSLGGDMPQPIVLRRVAPSPRSGAARGYAPVTHATGLSPETDAAIRGHVFCSLLALVLRKELEDRLAAARLKPEWRDLLADLDRLQEIEVAQDGKRLILRTPVTGVAGKAFQAVGVALPPNIRDAAAASAA